PKSDDRFARQNRYGPPPEFPLASSLSQGQRQQLRAEVRAYLLENPEVIVEALQLLEERRAQEALQADRDLVSNNFQAIYEDGHSYVGGNPEGDVTLVEFSDYRCGFCKQAHPDIARVLQADPNVRLIIKEFPILGPDSVAAGRMAIAAKALDEGRYGGLNDALMSYPGNLTERAAYRIAESEGYDVDSLRELAASDETTVKLEANYRLAQTIGIRGTPGFIVGDEIIRGLLPANELLALIDAERREARAQSN
ncbi:MAG: DsbA family protein, partial [Pseudomonadota bacterium]